MFPAYLDPSRTFDAAVTMVTGFDSSPTFTRHVLSVLLAFWSTDSTTPTLYSDMSTISLDESFFRVLGGCTGRRTPNAKCDESMDS
jgi:hypothetical protein